MPSGHPPVAEIRERTGLRPRYRMFTDGVFVEGGGEPLRTINPATEQVLAEVSTASGADVDAAVRAARRAFDKVWSRLPGRERARYLVRIARLVGQRTGELAELESLNTGIPITAARDGVTASVAHVFHHAGWADKLAYAGYGPDPKPLGVAGLVTGSDPALVLATRALAPALACGNTVVLKPSEKAPLSALVLAEICRQADLPPGVVNVLPGAADAGAALAGHPGLDKVAFTGSPEVGRLVQRGLAGTGRRLTLTLGGPATTVVFEDAPLDQVVDGIVGAIRAQPWASSQVLVVQPVADRLLDMLRARLAGLRLGDPLDETTEVGPLASGRRLERARELNDGAEADGARRWTSPAPLPASGFFLAPTMFSGVRQEMRIAGQNACGPVLAILTVATGDEAVTAANSLAGGLPVGVWTGQAARMLWAVRQMSAGVVWANAAHRADPAAPSGGFGASGLGREGGRLGLVEHLDV